ncbi:MAG: hypothetical protein WD971_01215 [Pirellulales bacterium]
MAVAGAFLVCVGCGSGNPWDPVRVSGKITYEDGSVIPVGGMRLYFMPQTPPIDAKTFPRQGVVGVNVSDGSFDKITTYKYADGLIPGKHKVIVAPSERRGGGGGGSAVTIPKEYTSLDTTPIEIDTADSPIHIKIRKP